MITTEEDDYTSGRRLSFARWLVELDDGRIVIDDDGRPGTTESSWLRLKAFLSESGRRIVSLSIQFRNNTINPLPRYAEGYFFRRSYGAFVNVNQKTYEFFLVGYLKNGIVHTLKFACPSLRQLGREAREATDEERVGLSLIKS